MRQSRRPDARQSWMISIFTALLAHRSRSGAAMNDMPPLQFKEVADAAGVRAEMRCGGPEKRWIPEANGSGVAWLDYDNDGRMDLLIVNGSDMATAAQDSGWRNSSGG